VAIPKGTNQNLVSIDMGHPIKTLKSLISKVINRKKSLETVNDLVRSTVIFAEDKTMQQFIGKLKRSPIISDYEFKSLGSDPVFGYFGTHHFCLMVNGIKCELQVMTNKVKAHKKVAGNIYAQYRDAIVQKGLDAVPEKAKRRSKAIFSRGNIEKKERKGPTREQLRGRVAAHGEALFKNGQVFKEGYNKNLLLAILEDLFNEE
jgi:hypothetical protein